MSLQVLLISKAKFDRTSWSESKRHNFYNLSVTPKVMTEEGHGIPPRNDINGQNFCENYACQ